MRGETPDNSNIVTVRIQGGIVDNWSVEMSDYYEFEYDKSICCSLHIPGWGAVSIRKGIIITSPALFRESIPLRKKFLPLQDLLMLF